MKQEDFKSATEIRNKIGLYQRHIESMLKIRHKINQCYSLVQLGQVLEKGRIKTEDDRRRCFDYRPEYDALRVEIEANGFFKHLRDQIVAKIDRIVEDDKTRIKLLEKDFELI